MPPTERATIEPAEENKKPEGKLQKNKRETKREPLNELTFVVEGGRPSQEGEIRGKRKRELRLG
jgi:hypothetical protein